MVKLGLANSRMKDFYDIWALSREFDSDGGVMSAAIQATFKRRKTVLSATMPLGLTSQFSGDPSKQTQWKAFVRRSKLKLATEGLEQVVVEIRNFLEAPVIAASQGEKLKAGGPGEVRGNRRRTRWLQACRYGLSPAAEGDQAGENRWVNRTGLSP